MGQKRTLANLSPSVVAMTARPRLSGRFSNFPIEPAEPRDRNVCGHRPDRLAETDVIDRRHRGCIECDKNQQILGIARIFEEMALR